MRSRAEAFGLERNIVAVSGAVFLLALGENLWKRFLPKYLETLGAPVTAIGFFGTCQDLLDGVYQYPGGWIGDRYGRRRALVLFVALAVIGYGIYWWAPTWPVVFAGLVFVMAWSSMASPTLFAVFLVLYCIDVVGISAPAYGILIGVQAVTAIVSYLPVARLADRIGRKPFVIATFVAFAAFPVAVVLAHDFMTLLVAFVVGGLREVGEPARKAMIVDLVRPSLRARSIGLYYLVRSLTVAPAAFIGGVLWKVTPDLPFWLAGAIGLIGVAVFAATVEERYAS